MKVIFLDIDGVLNVISNGRDAFGSLFHEHFVNNLKSIINETGAKIVISSTWRFSGLKVMKQMWKYRNLPGEVIDVTPHCAAYDDINLCSGCERGAEIKEWLDRNMLVSSYVIIDDDNDMLPSQMDYFVKTSGNICHTDCVDVGYGLTKECAKQAIAILNNTVYE